jgi:membrane associated rhomboid family serine protease
MALPLRDDSPHPRTPWVTYGIILANILVFLFVQPAAFQSGSGPDFDRTVAVRKAVRFEYKWAAIPCEIKGGRPIDGNKECKGRGLPDAIRVPEKSVWISLLSSLFLHANILHIAGNMLFLWVFGRFVEGRFGPLPFLALYLISGVAGTLLHVAFHSTEAVPVLGASGAIAGVMGAYLVVRPRGRILTVVTSASAQVVYVPAFVVLGLFFVTQFFTPNADQVAWQAHVGGMLMGAALALVLRPLVKDPAAPPGTLTLGTAARWPAGTSRKLPL